MLTNLKSDYYEYNKKINPLNYMNVKSLTPEMLLREYLRSAFFVGAGR